MINQAEANVLEPTWASGLVCKHHKHTQTHSKHRYTHMHIHAEAHNTPRPPADNPSYHPTLQELHDSRALLAAQQERLSAVHADEKAMDRAFKREFHDTDPALFAKLSQLYKQRLAAPPQGPSASAPPAPGQLQWPAQQQQQTAATATGATPRHGAAAPAVGTPRQTAGPGSAAALLVGLAPVEVAQLGDSSKPEALDLTIWERFKEFRGRRAQLELLAREVSAKAACAARQVAVLEGRSASLAGDEEAAAAEAAALRTARQAACMDVELRFKFKAGQVEAEHDGVSALLGGAVMVKRDLVEDLNEIVKSKGRQKVELLGQIKEFKKGIYALQWENKR